MESMKVFNEPVKKEEPKKKERNKLVIAEVAYAKPNDAY